MAPLRTCPSRVPCVGEVAPLLKRSGKRSAERVGPVDLLAGGGWVSYYQFHRSLRTMSYRGTFQEFCRRFMNDKLGYGSWFEHVQEFWEHRTDSNVLFLKYEDMHRDLVTMVEQLARFLGVSCDKAQLESLIEHCHQLVDQCCNAEALPVGRDAEGWPWPPGLPGCSEGRVGLWKDIFTVSMNEKFDLVYKQKMGKCDLTFDFYL
ncbi:PREDICTED: sulfotransferase 4A1 [Myotis davidii]|uniref:sulfotransferase 4A1 n=1 Tax=Myotis davidii TaxID=225400 RepID=UPI000767266A|nr:PREDICTED: sulfotransferase 4A1 [Myotis davidii]